MKNIESMDDLNMDKQFEIICNLLKNGGGYYTITAECIEDDFYLFYISNSLVCFEIINWEEYFLESQLQDIESKHMVKIGLISIAPSAISEDGPFIGEAIILDVINPN